MKKAQILFQQEGFGNTDGYTQVMPEAGGGSISYEFRTPDDRKGQGYINFAAPGEFVEGILHALFINEGQNGKIYNYSIWLTNTNIPYSVRKTKENPRPENLPIVPHMSYSFSATTILVERLDPLQLPSAVRIIYDGKPAGKNYKLWKVFQRPLTEEEKVYFKADSANGMTFGQLKNNKLNFGKPVENIPAHNPPKAPEPYGPQGTSVHTGGYAPTNAAYGQPQGYQAVGQAPGFGGGQQGYGGQPVGFTPPASTPPAPAFSAPTAPPVTGTMPAPAPAQAFSAPAPLPAPSTPGVAASNHGTPIPPPPAPITPGSLGASSTEEDDLPF